MLIYYDGDFIVTTDGIFWKDKVLISSEIIYVCSNKRYIISVGHNKLWAVEKNDQTSIGELNFDEVVNIVEDYSCDIIIQYMSAGCTKTSYVIYCSYRLCVVSLIWADMHNLTKVNKYLPRRIIYTE